MGKYDALFDEPEAEAGPAPSGKYAALFDEAPPPPSILDRLKSGAVEAARTAAGTPRALYDFAKRAVPAAIDLVSPISKTGGLQVPFGQLANPQYRREFERGISDTVTGGLAERAANAVSPEFAASAAQDAEANPDARAGGGLAGTFLPSPFKSAGNKAAQIVESRLARAPSVVRSALSAGADAATATGTQALASGASIPEAIGSAVGAGGLGAAGAGTVRGGGAIAEDLTSKARGRATKDIAHDIVAAEGKKARVTDQKRIAEVNERLFDLTRENPQLRDVWRQPAEKALPQIEAAKQHAAAPLDLLYKAVDARTGGIRLGEILDGFESEAAQAGKKASGQAEAARLRAVRENFVKAYGDDPDVRIPTAQFREEVTSLHKNAEQVMGGLEGTPRHEALSKLYEVGKAIIDQHLDNSGLSDTNLALLRKSNDRYFLLSRAEAAVESRGWKEANKPGFHLPHSVKAAVTGGSLTPMVAYGIMHPHAVPAMAAALPVVGAVAAAPRIASRANWALAQMNPEAGAAAAARLNPAAVAQMVRAARSGATRPQLQAMGQQLGMPPEIAANLAQENGQ